MQIFDKTTIRKIRLNRNILRRKLKVEIEINGNQVFLEGREEDKYTAEIILEAVHRNFEIDIALLLLDSDYVFEEIPVKDFTRKKNLSLVKARIIGTRGRTLELLEELSDSYITLQDNIVSVIGSSEKIKELMTAIKALIQGSKQSNIYSFLERQRKKFKPEGYGLKK